MGPKRALTPEQERNIVERYTTGEPALRISKSFNVHVQTIHNTLRRMNVSVRPELAKRRLTEHEKSLVVQTCLGGSTVEAAARLHGTSQKTVARILQKYDVSLTKGRPRSCTVNDSAFDTLMPESLYWAGFLFTDGCIHQDAYGAPALICGLAEKDHVHLEKLRSFLKSSHAITWTDKTRTSLGGPCVYFRVRSTGLCAALSRYGIVKKRTRVPVPELAKSRDFWRGAVDGDGWLGMAPNSSKYIYPHIGLSGQMPLLETFQDFLHENQLAPLNIHTTESGIWKIATTGSTARDIVKVLYDRATIALDRKLERARSIISGDETQSIPYTEEPSRRKLNTDIIAKILRDNTGIENSK